MLFHVFQSQAERRKLSGSDFIEIQYCRLPQGTAIHQIVSVDSIEHWKNDSLYAFGDNMDVFFQNYGHIITGGVYNNETRGSIDLFGINFYSREQAASIRKRLKTETPLDSPVLLKWLMEVEQCLGFYVLGV